MMKVLNGLAFWQRNELQHRGASHTHGLMWFFDAIDVCGLCEIAQLGFEEYLKKKAGDKYDAEKIENGLIAKKKVEKYAHRLVTVFNWALLSDSQYQKPK